MKVLLTPTYDSHNTYPTPHSTSVESSRENNVLFTLPDQRRLTFDRRELLNAIVSTDDDHRARVAGTADDERAAAALHWIYRQGALAQLEGEKPCPRDLLLATFKAMTGQI